MYNILNMHTVLNLVIRKKLVGMLEAVGQIARFPEPLMEPLVSGDK